MNELMDIIKTRRSCRKFTDSPVSDETIMELLEGARWAPSGSNIQPWYFGVVKEERLLKKIITLSPGINGNPQAIIALCADKKRAYERGGELGRDYLSVADISMASQNIMLLATEKGLGTCVIKSFNSGSVARLLKLPENVVPELLITVGYPAAEPVKGKRRPLDEVVFREQWGGKDE